jgi:hypothetical protein
MDEKKKIITIKNPDKLISPFHRTHKLISPFHRTHELLISPLRFSIKKKKKVAIDRRRQPLSSF